MEIIFIRHAEKINEEGDLGLSEKGIIQAKNLAKRLRKERFDELYSSNLNRAKETAKKPREQQDRHP
jgi:broad specificity phosphatase PhoE